MNTARTVKRSIAAALLAGGVATGLGPAIGIALATPGQVPQVPTFKICQTQTRWCPGRPYWHSAWHDDRAAGNPVGYGGH